jgi:hypothetical protein
VFQVLAVNGDSMLGGDDFDCDSQWITGRRGEANAATGLLL